MKNRFLIMVVEILGDDSKNFKVEKELYLTKKDLMSMFNMSDYYYGELMDGIVSIIHNNELVVIVYPKSENLYEGWTSDSSLISLKTSIRNYNISKL